MATDRDFLDYIAEQAGLGTRLEFRRLFGEYGAYLDGTVIAFACDNSLFIKPTAATADMTARLPGRPPYPGAKDYPVADELLDDGEALRRLLERTAEALAAAPKKKSSRKKTPSA